MITRSKKLLVALMVTGASFLAPHQVRAALTDGLISFWPLNESSGTREDTVGTNDLPEAGGSVSGTTGKIGNAAQFTNSSTGYLKIANNASFNVGGGDFTVSAWVYLDNRTGTQVFVGKYQSSGYALYYEPLSSAFLFSTYSGGGITTGSALGQPNTGTWYHLVGVHDAAANTNTLRINDQYQNSVSSVTDQSDTTGPFVVGAFNNSGQYTVNGRVDAVGLWNRVLTSGEITALYNSGNGVELGGDQTAPVISSVSSSGLTSSGATITWTTDEAGSTKVVYSADSNYASTTSESDTGTRVTSHSQALSGLLSCTLYNYKTVSRDASGNSATSTAYTFTTTGCVGGNAPSTSTSVVASVNTSATTSLFASSRTLDVGTPEDFTATSSSVVIQIKSFNANTVIAEIGKPNSDVEVGAGIVFDVTALIDNVTELSSFDVPITMSYAYTDADVSGFEESTLAMYHYSDGAWSKLTTCSHDVAGNTITCQTNSFSIFGLFGGGVSTSGSIARSTSSAVRFGCKDPQALNYEQFSKHSQALCRYEQEETVSQAEILAPINDVRDLTVGVHGDDVRLLQTFLISQNTGLFAEALAGVGATGYFGTYTRDALAEYQRRFDITPSLGYFGPITRAYLENSGTAQVWW